MNILNRHALLSVVVAPEVIPCIRKGSVPTKFCFVMEKEGRKPPTEQSKAPSSYLMVLMVCGNYSMKCCPLPLFELSSVPFVKCYS